MATVPENLEKILTARYGEEVRGAIYDSIKAAYDMAVDSGFKVGNPITSINDGDYISKYHTPGSQTFAGANVLIDKFEDAPSNLKNKDIKYYTIYNIPLFAENKYTMQILFPGMSFNPSKKFTDRFYIRFSYKIVNEEEYMWTEWNEFVSQSKSFNEIMKFFSDISYDYFNGDSIEPDLIDNKVLNPYPSSVDGSFKNLYKISDYIEITPGDIIVAYASSVSGNSSVSLFDKDKNLYEDYKSINNNEWNTPQSNYFIFKVPEDVRYMCLSYIEGQKENTKYKITDSILPIEKRPSVKNDEKWKGLKWTAVGDSLTEKNIRSTMNYHDYIAQKTGITVVNMGVGGSGYKNKEEDDDAFYQRISDVPIDSDVVTIFGSGNDMYSGSTGQLGSLNLGTAEDSGTDTVGGCINKTIDNLYERIPTVQLGIITPTPWKFWPPSDENNVMEQYSNLIIEICKRRGIPCLDLYHCSNLRPWDDTFQSLAYSKDEGNGTHPDETGHKIIASRFEGFLNFLLLSS